MTGLLNSYNCTKNWKGRGKSSLNITNILTDFRTSQLRNRSRERHWASA